MKCRSKWSTYTNESTETVNIVNRIKKASERYVTSVHRTKHTKSLESKPLHLKQLIYLLMLLDSSFRVFQFFSSNLLVRTADWKKKAIVDARPLKCSSTIHVHFLTTVLSSAVKSNSILMVIHVALSQSIYKLTKPLLTLSIGCTTLFDRI